LQPRQFTGSCLHLIQKSYETGGITNDPGAKNNIAQTGGHHSKPAAFRLTAGKDCPVIAMAQTLSRSASTTVWAIYVRRANNNSRELVVIFGASRRLQVLVCHTGYSDNAYALKTIKIICHGIRGRTRKNQ